jgi:hypothetical protein
MWEHAAWNRCRKIFVRGNWNSAKADCTRNTDLRLNNSLFVLQVAKTIIYGECWGIVPSSERNGDSIYKGRSRMGLQSRKRIRIADGGNAKPKLEASSSQEENAQEQRRSNAGTSASAARYLAEAEATGSPPQQRASWPREPEAEVWDHDRRRSPGLEWRNAGPPRKGCRCRKRGRDRATALRWGRRRILRDPGARRRDAARVPRSPPPLLLPPRLPRPLAPSRPPPSPRGIPSMPCARVSQVFPISCNLTIGRRRMPRQSAS